MKVPLSWLKDYLPIDLDPAEIRTLLDDLGLVVEGMEVFGDRLDGVVVAQVEEIAAIEGADKIRRVVVDAGPIGAVQVVCGAWNFAVGDRVPLATVGAVLPGNFAIAARKMKGVTSYGMLCSGRELGLSEDAAGIMAVDPAAPLGAPLADFLGLAPDVVYDIAVEGNRPDALCITGIARDLAARTGVPLSLPGMSAPLLGGPHVEEGAARATAAPASGAASATVSVECPDLCDRFGAWVIEGITVGPSPQWMQQRLTRAGMRPINNVVDVSNYVMLELGQPNHPYDLARLPGGGLVVRVASPGEKLETLDGAVRTLGLDLQGNPGPADCVICDASGGVVGIAGIMGGASSEIDGTTTAVLLEVAHFAPMAIARTSKRLGLRTEASVRFERGCDPAGIERAADRFAALLSEIAPPGSTPRVTARVGSALGSPPPPGILRLRTDRVNALLGTTLATAEVARHLESIGFAGSPVAEGSSGGVLEVRVPTFRPDCEREIDLIEEVARLHGYSSIPRAKLAITRAGGLSQYQRERRRLRDAVAHALGACEAWTPSFLGPGDNEKAGFTGRQVAVTNPVAREESVLRRSMLPGMLRALAHNTGHRNPSIRLFEIGHVFRANDDDPDLVPDEWEKMAVLFAQEDGEGRDEGVEAAVTAWRTVVEVLRLDHLVLRVPSAGGAIPGLHPMRAARIEAAGKVVGVLGEVDPAVAAAFGCPGRRIGWIEVFLGWESSAGRSTDEGTGILGSVPRRPLTARIPSVLPSADFDLSFVVDDSWSAGSVCDTLQSAAGELASRVELFDVFRAEVEAGTRSLAFRIRLEPTDATLTDAEIGAVRKRCIDAVMKEHGAVLRG